MERACLDLMIEQGFLRVEASVAGITDYVTFLLLMEYQRVSAKEDQSALLTPKIAIEIASQRRIVGH